MKQNIDLTFCTQQELDSFSIFFNRRIAHTVETHILHTKDLPMAVSLKYDTVKNCEIFFRK